MWVVGRRMELPFALLTQLPRVQFGVPEIYSLDLFSMLLRFLDGAALSRGLIMLINPSLLHGTTKMADGCASIFFKSGAHPII